MSRSFKPVATWMELTTCAWSGVRFDIKDRSQCFVKNGKHFWKRRVARQQRAKAKQEIIDQLVDREVEQIEEEIDNEEIFAAIEEIFIKLDLMHEQEDLHIEWEDSWNEDDSYDDWDDYYEYDYPDPGTLGNPFDE